jgi:hypothetical protein
LALALIVVVGAASASSPGFRSTLYPAYVLGGQTGASVLTTQGASVKCSSQNITGTVKAADETPTFAVADGSCSLGPMKMNGCGFAFHPGAQGTGPGTFDIGPAGCGPITSSDNCSVSIPSQTGLAATFTNSEEGGKATVTVQLEASGLKYSRSGCGVGNYSDGSFSGFWQLKSYANSSYTSQTGLHVATLSPVGVYVGTKEGGTTKLEGEKYPLTISGAQTKSLTLLMSAGTVKCKGVSLKDEASGASAEVPFEAEHKECTGFGQSSTWSMNSCHYVLKVTNSGSPYTGSLGLVCSTEGDAIKINTPAGNCSLTVPPQTVGSVTLENVGAGTGRKVVTVIAGSGLSYTVAGPGVICGTVGAHSDGKFNGTIELQGSRFE